MKVKMFTCSRPNFQVEDFVKLEDFCDKVIQDFYCSLHLAKKTAKFGCVVCNSARVGTHNINRYIKITQTVTEATDSREGEFVIIHYQTHNCQLAEVYVCLISLTAL